MSQQPIARNTIRIATRKSALALWQAEFIKSELERLHDNVTVELVKIKTQGDKILDVPPILKRNWKRPCWQAVPTWRCTP